MTLASASGGSKRRKSNESLLPREAAFYTRTYNGYQAMKQRFGPKFWKTGKRKGTLRDPGRQVPFNVDQFQQWYQSQLGGTVDGICVCSYCPVNITAMDATVDHKHPVAQGGSLDLDNLCLCCAGCNRLKGKLTVDGFAALKLFLESLGRTSFFDAADIEKRLKGGIIYRKTKARKP